MTFETSIADYYRMYLTHFISYYASIPDSISFTDFTPNSIPWSSSIAIFITFVAFTNFSFLLLFQSQISFAAYGHILNSPDLCMVDFITFVLSSHLLFSLYLRFHLIFSISQRDFKFLSGSSIFFISFHTFYSFYDRL